ncbi:MAG TPA: YigZ family protein [Bacteroidales bacterium]|nr:YigZ family protein [Bacteroidales bacterium]
MIPDTYLTVKSFTQGLYKEKGSRFISFVWPVSDEEEIRSILENTRKEHHSARHHCYAWVLGPQRDHFRANDDGEPSGSAGKPILGQINSRNLTNILIVVVRYFGGKLLGVSGLINAYRSAAASALGNAGIVECQIREKLGLIFPYASLNDVMRIIKEEEITISEQRFELECSMTVSVRASSLEHVINQLSRIENIIIRKDL